MSDDNNRMTDAVRADLNPPAEETTDGGEAGLRRPADSATKAAWVDYVVGLGADRAHVEGGSWHYRPDLDNGYDAARDGEPHPAYEQAAALTKGELVDLADRLGG